MVESWKDKAIITSNEEIETGADNFIDDRGIISNYYFDDSINMIGYVESKKETTRGNHYHPIQTQKCLLIKGKYISCLLYTSPSPRDKSSSRMPSSA